MGKNHGAAHKSTIIREITGEERTSWPLCIYNGILDLTHPNDGVFSFIKIIRVISYEITKLPLTCFLCFAGKEASRLDWTVSAKHL